MGWLEPGRPDPGLSICWEGALSACDAGLEPDPGLTDSGLSEALEAGLSEALDSGL